MLLDAAPVAEVGAELEIIVREVPGKLKSPQWQIEATLTNASGNVILSEGATMVEQPRERDQPGWLLRVLPLGAGTLTLVLKLSEGKLAEEAELVVEVEPKPTPQVKLEKAMEANDVELVIALLDPDRVVEPGADIEAKGNDAADPEAADPEAEAGDELASPPQVAQPRWPEEDAEELRGWPWSWDHSKSGESLVSILLCMKVSEEEQLLVLDLIKRRALQQGSRAGLTRTLRKSPAGEPNALHRAIQFERPAMLEGLLALCPKSALAHECYSHVSSRFAFTPLHTAAEMGDADAVRVLLEVGAVPDAAGSREPLTLTRLVNGRLGTPSPLALACERGDLPVARMLVNAGAKLSLGTADTAHSALALAHRAAAAKNARTHSHGKLREVDPLIEYLLDEPQALAALTCRAGVASLDDVHLAACSLGLHEVVSALHRRGVKAAPHPDGRSALYEAMVGGHLETVKLLLAAGADACARFADEPSGLQLPLSVAVSLADVCAAREISWLLRSHGADVSATETNGLDALAIASELRPADEALLADLRTPIAAPPLPFGWVEAYDERSKRPFYFHYKTKDVSWEKPRPAGYFGRPAAAAR